MTMLPPSLSAGPLTGGAHPGGLGAPGVYHAAASPARRLVAEPMDVVAFVGVAPRGPAWVRIEDPLLVDGVPEGARARSVAVPVESWDDYAEQFGAFEGPGLLPHAVATFFAQGGRRARVIRIVHDEHGREGSAVVPLGCAHHDLADPARGPFDQPVVNATDGRAVRLRAGNEGTWGQRLVVTLSFVARPIAVLPGPEATELVLDVGIRLVAGDLVRLRSETGQSVLRVVQRVFSRGRAASAVSDRVAALDQPVLFAPVTIEHVSAELEVVDLDPSRRRRERFDGLGLQPTHPRFLGDVLAAESRLVEMAGPVGPIEVRDPGLPAMSSVSVADVGLTGEDRWHLVTPADVFGRLAVGDESGIDGLDALLRAPDVATVVVPDLYSPAELPSSEPVDLDGVFAGPTFEPCLVRPTERFPAPPTRPLTGLHLDPADPAHLELIIAWQQELVAVAERLRMVALLDVPPRLRGRAVDRWRARFDSDCAAAYFPWLRAPAGDLATGGRSPFGTAPLVEVPPSAVAAGLIARCELRSGVPRGPANEPAAGVVDVAEVVNDQRHGDLHRQGIDVFHRRPDGVWLTGARTLSLERHWRQLTVRRLVHLVERTVLRQLQWTVFEPNDAMLRAGLRRVLDGLLGDLFALGAFAGATPGESWFVRVADASTISRESDRGEVVVEVGVAPAEPIEFIVVRAALDAEGAIEPRLLGAGTAMTGVPGG
jgi:uncharacterized protein